MIKHYEIRVKGIVQGVGFRPFIYHIASKNDIKGTVINDTAGVLIHAEGSLEKLERFSMDIEREAPPLAYITSIDRQERQLANYEQFSIGKSAATKERMVFYSPDVAVCQDCLDEFFDKSNRRYHYPFITCTHCGPRFSIVNDIPYDRENTTMNSFPLCHLCHAEYTDPDDRRFHTQPTACSECGPHLSLYDREANRLSEDIDEIASRMISLLKNGQIGAVKGVGGYHLVADACNHNAVARLRNRKKRPFKPFALMAGSIKVIESFLEVNDVEKKLLESKERPIVLLKEKAGAVARNVAPGISWHGVMLPYTPFHHLLFSLDPGMVLVMTSGNLSDEPIVYNDDEAFARLKVFADFFVSYNREIVAQNDDSVFFVEFDREFVIRRSRGYIPLPFQSKMCHSNILAVGGDLKNSFAIAGDEYIIMSQYVGDMADMMTHETYKKSVDHFVRIFDAPSDVIVSDMHPGYLTTSFADEMAQSGLKRIQVQHHHAHIASVMEEQGLKEKVIGIAFDGTGYGTDGTLWGSEFLIADKKEFIRAGHFANFHLPGGEAAIKDVWKIGLSLLYQAYGDTLPGIFSYPEKDIIIDMIKRNIQSPQTCSIGRIFDGISAILGISHSITSEAEAAMLLEEAAHRGKESKEPFIIPWDSNGGIIISTGELVRYVVSLLNSNTHVDDIAASFHQAIYLTAVKVVIELSKNYKIRDVVLSGGVFHNRILLRSMYSSLKKAGFNVYVPEKVPVNDGCIALGQVAVAKELMEE